MKYQAITNLANALLIFAVLAMLVTIWVGYIRPDEFSIAVHRSYQPYFCRNNVENCLRAAVYRSL